ncbi:DUF1636 family protein [Gloeocapsopsis dulcis]|uniref:Metal-binding protein n=1 Tax=Gloeocapsopsis dulcis AAB1 = 1H9 TaxID=1433147 RepID=A0A6N8FX38_9CHRO|nr:DUF1636 domain-containing protein [Gloeocapsopsis dulcis]MUL37324.1 hypothetical protein [Gloeocapsopsis dulcis AAB1 = 1H9]WNN88969.1 DUF1636 domain-containing protein [Gloeocapsopsis dulcis]
MHKHTLLVCKSCNRSSEELPENQLADGTRLIEQLNTLGAEQKQFQDLRIQPVGCLWTCDRPCAVAFSAFGKPTYLFTNLPADDTAAALLQFGELYLKSKTGNVPWQQFPEKLQQVSIAKIPTMSR